MAEDQAVPLDAPARARSALAAGDYAGLVDLIDARAVELWFEMPPDEFGRMMLAIPAAELVHRPQLLMLRGVFSPSGAGADPAVGVHRARPHPVRRAAASDRIERRWVLLVQAMRARLSGDAGRAYGLLRDLPEVVRPVEQLIDHTGGQGTLFVAQTALSAALAGEFSDALVLYERLLLMPSALGLQFIQREAHLRLALLHGLFGDHGAARIHRSRAAETVRSSSWVEQQLDAEQQLVDALLLIDEDADAAVEWALRLTYGPMGEMWPFFVMIAQRAAMTAGRGEDGRARLEVLRATGLAAPGGSGMGANVFGQELGFDAVMHGNVVRARAELGTADPDHWRTRMFTAVLALVTSNPRLAMRELGLIEAQTRGLRQVERRREALLALARFAEGDEDGALSVLGKIARRAGSFDQELLALLSPAMLDRVKQSVPGLVLSDHHAPNASGLLDRPHLSSSEMNVLSGLRRGLSRDEIAESLFVSPNTVKTQQRSLYRKLGVSSAAAAIAEAVRLGLF